jgi:hypothetical protein
MAVTTSLGTVFSAVKGVPATYDQAGFAALSFTAVGEVADIGEFGGEGEILTHTPIATGVVNKLLGSIDYGTIALQMGRFIGDAGQTLLKGGFDGADQGETFSFSVVYIDGAIDYFTGIVSSFSSVVGSASSVRGAASNIALNNKVIEA